MALKHDHGHEEDLEEDLLYKVERDGDGLHGVLVGFENLVIRRRMDE